MRKILAINSPLFENTDEKNEEDYLPPLGLGIIVSSLDTSDVYFIDSIADNLSLKDFVFKINKTKPDFVLINIFTTNFILVKKIVEAIKVETHWVIGGLSTKAIYKEIFNWDTFNKIDIVYGDGEIIINDIITSSLLESPLDSGFNRRYFKITDSSCYYVKNISNEKLDRKFFLNEPQENIFGELEICMYSSRGCIFNCAYCVAAHSRNRELGKTRKKSKFCLINEIRKINSQFPKVNSIRILDDLFLADKKCIYEAASIFEKFNYSWRAMCHIKSIDCIDDDALKNLKYSGCKELFIGIESGSEKILSKIHKAHNVELVKKSVERVLSIGINIKGYFICGFPDESINDFIKTYKLAKDLHKLNSQSKGDFRNSTFQFRPYYGTEICDKIIQKNSELKSSILYNVKPSEKMNKIVRNKSFNFDSGNYSKASDKELYLLLKQMNDLNNNDNI